jgi:hypothetical protein
MGKVGEETELVETHSSNAAMVEDFYHVQLELGECPGIISPKDDVDSGSDIKPAADGVEGYHEVSEKFFA